MRTMHTRRFCTPRSQLTSSRSYSYISSTRYSCTWIYFYSHFLSSLEQRCASSTSLSSLTISCSLTSFSIPLVFLSTTSFSRTLLPVNALSLYTFSFSQLCFSSSLPLSSFLLLTRVRDPCIFFRPARDSLESRVNQKQTESCIKCPRFLISVKFEKISS